jgi:hypothetical protein
MSCIFTPLLRSTGDQSGAAYGLGLQSTLLPCGGLDPGGTDAQDTDMQAAVTTALPKVSPPESAA